MQKFDIPVIATDFSTTVEQIAEVVDNWAQKGLETPLNLDQFIDCVYIKLPSRAIAYTNAAYQNFYCGPVQAVGTVGETYLDSVTQGLSVKSDELLISSGKTVEFDHVSIGPDRASYNVKTHKRWIRPNGKNLSILGITRVIVRVPAEQFSAAEILAKIAQKYEALEANDRALCYLIAAGNSQREMAEMLGCTTRTIENRRNRIMVELGVSKPIDIVKLMVRMAEHGLIEADF